MQSFAGDFDGGRVGKRNRPPTSCEPCRIRKLRCNRGYPCGTCIQRHKQSSCEYAANANRNKTARSSLGDRLQNLENAVFQIVQHGVTINSGESETRNSRDVTTALGDSGQKLSADTSGSLHVDNSQMTYVDSNHWLSILDDIKEVREQFCLSNNQLLLDQQVEGKSPERELDLMFSPMPSHEIREILHSLPPRHVCDNLLSLYFNLRFMILPIVHPTKFQKEYEEFWHDSSKTPIIWIGLLFSILSVAAVVRQINDSAEDPIGDTISTDVFRLRTRQCIVLGKYSSARSYGLETLVLHLQSNFMGLVDSNVSLWFLLGIIIRLAMRLGYHRDSKIHSTISPFEGEMRRRIWANIYQMDVLTSFQLGLPSMIPSECCDTAAPRNLNYSDFSPDTTVLPPSRPLSDHTPVSYTIVKGKVMNVFKKIVSHTQALSPGLPEAMTVLDLELRETYTNIPTGFKMRPISQSFMDTSSTIMNRCNIELLYLKAVVVLHRRYLNSEMRSPEYSNSRSVCLDAALRILAIQADVHQSSQSGGRLYKDRWMVSSLNAHDFLLAAMIVCLDLSVLMRTASAKRDKDLGKKLDALQTSHRIWAFASSFSKDANTAAQVLALMIQKIENLKYAYKSSDSFVTGGNILNTGESGLQYADHMSDMLDGPENLDWTLLDQYLQNNDTPYDADLFSSNVDFGEGGF